jgi:DNA-binding MarR family transcriptional regulator
VTLTDKGRELIDEAVVAGLETQEEFLSPLPPAKRKQLDSLLRQLLSGR